MTHSPAPPLITILGPTASGKTKLAVSLAQTFSGEIISADSRQVYKGMDIGTGKDLQEYLNIPHHLIDVIEPNQEYNLFEYASEFKHSLQNIQSRNKLSLLVGGTGMYIDAILSRYKLTIAKSDENARRELENKPERELIALLKSFDNNLHNTTDLTDRSRLIRAIEIAQATEQGEAQFEWPAFRSLIIGIRLPREILKKRITARLKARFEEGMIDEVKTLHQSGITWDKLHFFGLEYRFIAQYLQGELTYNDMFQKLNSAIHAFSKQQNKWFRNIEKKGHTIQWLDADQDIEAKASMAISEFLANQ
jgi:tRNA dimethylallyltransferase